MEGVHAGAIRIEPRADAALPPFAFSDEDAALLDEVQRGAFAFFVHAVDPVTGMVRDRTSTGMISVAGVGYQLAALVIGVERGWIDRADAGARAELILDALLGEPTNRKAGLFYHFLHPGSAKPFRLGSELVVSTIDSAILLSGAIVAGEYFGGRVEAMATEMARAADWSFFQNHKVDFERGDSPRPNQGFLSLGWRPADDNDPTGPGALIPYSWVDCGDEHRLATFLAASAHEPAHAIDADTYYRLRRQIAVNPYADPTPTPDDQAIASFPYSGALFTAFFAHCWLDYAAMGTDAPGVRGIEHRAGVNWWENSRRLVGLHRDKAIANPEGVPTVGPDAWGLSACDGPEGYLVLGVYPRAVPMLGAVPARDFPNHRPDDQWGGGVVAPYAAGSSIVFEPALSISAMRHFRGITDDASGKHLAWLGAPADPMADSAVGRYGFADSYRAGTDGGNGDEHASPWTAPDTVAIDHGPLLVLIENARTGLVWDLFHRDSDVAAGLERLGLSRDRSGGSAAEGLGTEARDGTMRD